MSTKFEGRSSHYDLIEDIVESPASSSQPMKTILNRNYSAYSSLPSALNQTDHPSTKLSNEVRDRLQLTLPRSNSSLIMMSNDERRKEIDLIIKQLYDGKLINTTQDEQPTPDGTESLATTATIKTEKGNKNNVEHLDVSS